MNDFKKNAGPFWKTVRRFSLIFLLFLIPACLVAWAFYYNIDRTRHSLQEEQLKATLAKQKNAIHNIFEGLLSDLSFVMKHHDRDFFLRDITAPSNMTNDLTNFCESRGVYDQMRILDAEGRERLRINYHPGEGASSVSIDLLQDKRDRYYFKECWVLPVGTFYISPLDLNVEHGEIEQPPKPMIRLAASFTDKAGTKVGVVVLNYLAADLLRNIALMSEGVKGSFFLLNSEGYWLQSDNVEDSWGFMFPERLTKTFANRYPLAWMDLVSCERNVQNLESGLFVHETVYPLQRLDGRFREYPHKSAHQKMHERDSYSWKLVALQSREWLQKDQKKLRDTILLPFLLYLLLAGLIAWRLSVLQVKEHSYLARLRTEEEGLRQAQILAHMGNWEWNLVTDTLHWSDEIFRILGRKKEESPATYKAFLAAVHPDDRILLEEAINKAITFPGEPYEIEHRIVQPDGSIRDVIEQGRVDFLDNQEPGVLVGTVQDITNHKEMIQQLRLAEFALNHTQDALFWLREDGSILDLNEAACQRLGYTRDELLSMKIWQVDQQYVKTKWISEWLKIKEKGHAVVHSTLRPKQGDPFAVEVNATFIAYGGAEYVFALVRDITERIQAEKAIKESELKNRLLVENLPDVVLILNVQGTIEYINRTETGLKKDQVLGKQVFDLVAEECRELYKVSFQRAIHNHQLQSLQLKSQHQLIYDTRLVPLLLPDGELRVMVIATDVTLEKQEEKQLQIAQFSLDHVSDSIFWIYPDGRFMDVNLQACRSLEFSREELLKLSVPDIDPNFPHATWGSHWADVKQQSTHIIESRHQTKSGRQFPVEIAINYFNQEGEEFICAIARNMSERKATEACLVESEARFRRLTEGLQREFFFYTHNAEGIFTYVSPSMTNILGYTRKEFLLHYVSYLTDHPINQLVRERSRLSLLGDQQEPYVLQIYHKDHRLRWLEVYETPVINDNGEVVHVEGIAHDITQIEEDIMALIRKNASP